MRCAGLCAIAVFGVSVLAGAEHQGQVIYRGLPVPGVSVTMSQGGRKAAAVTDQQGFYAFPDLTEGVWTVEVEMFGFAAIRREIAVVPGAPAAKWELTMLPLDRIKAEVRPTEKRVQPAEPPPEEDLSERAADGFLISGSVNNAAASPFSQAAAFGNNRRGGRGLYNGGIGVMLGNSALDARPFSLTGQNTPKADYSRVTGMANFGGPLQIPHLFRNGPMVFAGYQWTRNNNATTATALVPTLAQRSLIPESRMSPQARALLAFYPLPNFEGGTRHNYQVPILSPTHQDALQSRAARPLGSSDQVFGHFNFQSARTDTTNLFAFRDTTDTLGLDTAVNWTHRFNQRLFLNLGVQFSRLSTRVTPYFANRVNVSGEAGITGNNQDPVNWGPPALHFASGIAGLSGAQSSFNRNRTTGLTASMFWNRRAHNFTFGGSFRRQSYNCLGQQDARGTFTFTGAETGSDFADFLLGIPATSSIAFGNADKYFRQSVYDAYITDDWRMSAAVTLNAGVRWEYGAPVTELYGRLANLEVAPGFRAAAPVVASSPGRHSTSLVEPYRGGFAPRVGIAWRPAAGSPLIVRAGYGIYYDTSVYQNIALRMAQQPPLSKTWSVGNSAANPITLADAFAGSPAVTGNTFAIDPNYRPGYAQTWQLGIQSDLPGALQIAASYLGIKGTHAMQAFLPNTIPAGAANPCASCPTGFAYLVSSGNSSRQAGQMQLRRRLRNGFTATLQYTFSKSIDDAAVLGGRLGQNAGGFAIAQNWLDLRAERGLSTFDQRHLLSLQTQYTTGIGNAAPFREWTFGTQIAAGSGLPQTPVYLAPVQGTGVTGTLRPDSTGAPLYAAAPGLYLNPAAYTPPRAGQWGNAGRNSITGPARFTLNASVGRTFRAGDRLNLDLRVDSTNALNRVNFTQWNTTVNSMQFGLPAAADGMRSVQTTLRLRF